MRLVGERMKGERTDLLIVVPARGGSKRLPRKHIRALAGRTLLEWTQDAIVQAGLRVPCLLTTDDDEISEAGRRLGWWVPFRRPASLATDTTPTLPVAMHALEWFAREHGGDPAQVMVLQVTSPLRGGACLRKAVMLLADHVEAEAVVGVRRLGVMSPYVFEMDGKGFLRSRRTGNGAQPVYVPNGAMYLIRTAALRAQQTLFPHGTLPLVMDDLSSIDIDSELDWRLAEAALTTMPELKTSRLQMERPG